MYNLFFSRLAKPDREPIRGSILVCTGISLQGSNLVFIGRAVVRAGEFFRTKTATRAGIDGPRTAIATQHGRRYFADIEYARQT